MERAVFLDRDGTLVRDARSLTDPQQVELMPGAGPAIAALRDMGYRIVVISNQGQVAKGVVTEQDVRQINQRIVELVRQTPGATIDRFYFCPFSPSGTIERYTRDHPWRKPQPGMLLQAAEDLQLDLSESWLVGDHTRDIVAGKRAGVRTVQLLDADAELPRQSPDGKPIPQPDHRAATLMEAARIIATRRPATVTIATTTADALTEIRAGAARREEAIGWPPPIEAETVDVTLPVETQAIVEPKPAHGRDRAAPPASDATGDEVAPRHLHTHAHQPRDESPAAELPHTEAAPPAAAAPPTNPPQPNDPAVADLLQQILRELKSRRTDGTDFSMARLAAWLAQMFVIGFVVFAIMTLRDGPTVYFQWLAAAILAQITVIALLIVSRME